MPQLNLTTVINAPLQRVFDLSRSIDLHKISTQQSREEVIAGVTTGLINCHETVTWQAKHLGKTRQFTSKIMEMNKPAYFVDEMIMGDFKKFRHEHYFKTAKNGTLVIDIVQFESPYAFIGRMVNRFYLSRYLEKLLVQRNSVIKEYAETNKWKAILL